MRQRTSTITRRALLGTVVFCALLGSSGPAQAQQEQRPRQTILDVITTIQNEQRLRPNGTPVQLRRAVEETLFGGRATPQENALIDQGIDLVQRFGPLAAQIPAVQAQAVLGEIRIGSILTPFLKAIDFLLTLAMWVLGALLSLASAFIDFILSFQRLAGAPAVQQGWRVTRDLLNFTFILALLAIAFATIAGIESYNMKQLLPRLIVAALLVNFSLAISGAFIQTATILARSAVQQLGGLPGCRVPGQQQPQRGFGISLTCHMANTAGVRQLYAFGPQPFLTGLFGVPVNVFQLQPGQANDLVGDFGVNFSLLASKVVAVAFVAFFYVAMLVLAIMLAVRVGVLLILLMVSPAPYVFSVIPKLSRYAEQWWDTFLRYVFFYPIIVFFLVQAILLMNGNGIAQQLLVENPRAALGARDDPAFRLFTTAFDLFFMSVFMVVAIWVAKKFGIHGADSVIGFARRFTTAVAGTPPLMAARAGGYAAREVGRGAGGLAGRIPVVGGALRAARSGIRGLEALRTGKESSELVEEQRKSIKGYSTERLKPLMAGGNAGAAAELLDRNELKEEQELKQALAMAPAGSALREKTQKAFEQKLPIQAITGLTTKEIEAGTSAPAGSPARGRLVRAIGAKRKELAKALRKVKPEDFARMSDENMVALADAVDDQMIDIADAIPNAGQLRRGAEEGSPEMQVALSRLATQARGAMTRAQNLGAAAPPRLQSVRSTLDRFFP